MFIGIYTAPTHFFIGFLLVKDREIKMVVAWDFF